MFNLYRESYGLSATSSYLHQYENRTGASTGMKLVLCFNHYGYLRQHWHASATGVSYRCQIQHLTGEKGFACSLYFQTDDKGVFCTSMSAEHKILSENYNMDLKKLWCMADVSIQFCFASLREKFELVMSRKKWLADNKLNPLDLSFYLKK